MNAKILITGASGNLGNAIVRKLSKKNVNIIAGTRNTKNYQGPGEAKKVDYSDPESFGPALEGVEKVLLMAPPMDATAAQTLPPFIDVSKKVGVKKIILVSAFGADTSEEAPLRIIERHLMGSGISFTILRPNFYMENFTLGFALPMIKHQNGLFLAAADGKTSFISVEDIASVVVKTMTEDGHDGKEYNLTGPRALDHNEIVEIISSYAGRAINYVPITMEEQKNSAIANGMPEPAAEYMNMLYGAVSAGYSAGITNDFETITGNKPISFREFADINGDIWK